MAQYLVLIYENEAGYETADEEMISKVLKGHQVFGEKHEAALRGGNALQPTSTATTIRKSNSGEVTITDGPFAETKEVIAGFAIIETKSKEEAVQWGVRFLKIAGEGTSELRALGEPPPR
jgi:hypothetical protein